MSESKRENEYQKRRYFTGKLNGFESKKERNFQKKNLKAYIKGKSMFAFGFNQITKKPVYYITSEEWRKEE